MGGEWYEVGSLKIITAKNLKQLEFLSKGKVTNVVKYMHLTLRSNKK